MGLWSFLKRAPPKELELSLDEVPAFVEKALSKKRKGFEETVAKRFSEIKHFLVEANAALSELKKHPLEAKNPKLKKIVGTAREQAIARLSSLFEKLQPPPQIEPNAVKRYCVEGLELLQREIEQGGKSIAYTGIYLKDSIKSLGQSVKDLTQTLSSLNKQIDEFSALFSEASLRETLQAIKEKSRAIALINSEIKRTNKALIEATQNKRKLASKLSELRESHSFKELATLRERKSRLLNEKQSKKTELFSMLSSIDKPLKRFSKAVECNKISVPKHLIRPLQQLQRNPLQLLKGDPKGQLVKEILLELKRAIESNAVELKERERSKRLAAIDELLGFNFFSKVFWEFNEIDSKLLSIEREIKENKANAELVSLEARITEADKLVQETGFSLEALKRRLERSKEELASLKHQAEGLLQEISPSPITLK